MEHRHDDKFRFQFIQPFAKAAGISTIKNFQAVSTCFSNMLQHNWKFILREQFLLTIF